MLAVTRAVGQPADVVTEALETFQAHASGKWDLADDGDRARCAVFPV